ncbi:6610_t:CDS:2 [Rhizophagus irregularis]|nr:6610_t:CDS:2 [Rhizophagus irregularis]
MSLTEDCIREILEYLSNDKKSLYSCLLTNRLFFRFIVPILWRDPWININLESVNLREQMYWNFIGRTISKCFSQEIKQFPILLKNHKQNYLLQQQPLFDYILYIQVISAGAINNLTKNIFEDNNNEQIEQKINKQFWTFFMKRCLKIKSLDMPNFNLLLYPESKKFFSTISTLKIFSSYPKDLILELSKKIHTLNHSINYLSKSLKILELCSCDYLPIQKISPFINLIELKICFRILYDDENFNINFNQISLPNLEILSLINVREKDLSTFTNLIETTQGSLKILNILLKTRSSTSLSSFSILSYLQTIKMICPNIEVLPIWLISGIPLKEFEDLLKSCKKLRKIIIHAIIPLNKTVAKSILYLLATKSSSNYLNNIHLIGSWNFSNLDQEIFDLWKEKKRKPLELILNNNNIHSNYIIKFLVTNGNRNTLFTQMLE